MNRPKTTWDVVDHRARRLALQGARLASWWLQPKRWPARERFSPARHGALDALAAEVRVPIARADGHAEPALERGKRHNLAIAARAFDAIVLAGDRPLSFWRTLGRVDERRGYTWGMELRGGCVVPAIGGGLCLLANALFEVAVRAGFAILERHGHTLEAIPPAPGALVLDATVAWPDVDLVIAPVRGAARLSVQIEDDELRVATFLAQPNDERLELENEEWIEARGDERWRHGRVLRRRFAPSGALIAVEEMATSRRRLLAPDELGQSCISCGEHECRDRPAEPVLVALGRRAR